MSGTLMSQPTITPALTVAQQNAIDPMKAKQGATVAYTDGACKGNPGAGGWGAHLIFSDGRTQDLYGGAAQTTNNRMELMGAIQALINSPREVTLEIWTDSSYVKDGISEWITNWKKRGWKTASKKSVANQDLWQQLDELRQGRAVEWHWVKGHAGHAGNEKADELANLGVTSRHDHDNSYSNNSHSHLAKKKVNTTLNNTQALADNHWINTDPLGFDMLGVDMLDCNITAELEDAVATNTRASHTTPPSPTKSHSQHVINNQHPIMPMSTPTMTQTTTDNTLAIENTVSPDTPTFDGDTSRANPYFRPLLPKPIHRHETNRQLIMDTETTGLDALKGDRIIEVGIVEMVGRKLTGEKLHVYINPQRGMNEEVIRIHGISEAFLADKPTFAEVAQALYEFMDGAELIAHNATFDMNFLTMEFAKVGLTDFAQRVQVTDSLIIAKRQYPGQKNNLNALVRRLNVGKQDRTFHGALLDSEILAEVYLAMTGGQVSLGIEEDVQSDNGQTAHAHFASLATLLLASTTDNTAHQNWFADLSDAYPEIKTKMAQW